MYYLSLNVFIYTYTEYAICIDIKSRITNSFTYIIHIFF